MTEWECYDPDTGEWYIASVDMQSFADALQDLINEWNLEAQFLAVLIQYGIENLYDQWSKSTQELTQELIDSIDHFLESLPDIPDRPRYPMVRQYSKCKTPDKNLIWKPRVKARSRL